MTDTDKMREHAGYLIKKAEESIETGDVARANELMVEAQKEIADADENELAIKRMDALKAEVAEPINSVPVTSSDIKDYDPNDIGAKTKASYRPASWVKGLPAACQPLWVQEKMGDREKEEAIFYKDTYTKWMTSPSQDMWRLSATSDELKAMQEDTDAEGGYFVPEEFINQVIHDTGVPTGQLRPQATVVRVSGKDGYLPTIATATWGAIAEEAAYTGQESTPTVGQVQYSIEKSGGMVRTSRELLDDSAINLPSILSQIFAEASGRFEDVGILNGNDTTNYAGILASGGDYTMASATAVTAADIMGIYFTLEAQHRANATWVMPSLISKEINGIQVTGAGVHAIQDLTTAPAEFLLGKRVINNDVSGNGLATSITANDEIAIFGDMRNYYIFDRVGFSIRRNDSLYMENDQIGFFGTRRGDGQVGLAAAFKILKAAAS